MAAIDETVAYRVTKYIPDEFLDATLSGSIKLGSLDDYRLLEAPDEKRLTDKNEGRADWSVGGDVRFDDHIPVRIGNGFLSGFSIINRNPNTPSFTVGVTTDALVFCTSIGDYSLDSHRDFLNSGNEDCTSYVVFDRLRLEAALRCIANEWRIGQISVLSSDVSYVGRVKRVDLDKLQRIFSNGAAEHSDRICKALFCKSKIFDYEKEWRMALIGDETVAEHLRRPILTSMFSDDCKKQIASAVIRSGTKVG